MRGVNQKNKVSKIKENFLFNNHINFITVQDHILESKCQHNEESTPFCQVCKYEKELSIPHLPEMIFANNTLTLILQQQNGEQKTILQFNSFDALSFVEVGRLPDIKVKPSKVWQEARKDLLIHDFQKPFDWTYTSNYKGTTSNVKIESTDEAINFEKLKLREPILFYSEMTLYEDELSDYGCSRMKLRVRVMPSSFFILCRFYLRVDDVIIRIIDTRIFHEIGKPYMIREWSRREATYELIKSTDYHKIHDENQIIEFLPQIELERTKLSFVDLL